MTTHLSLRANAATLARVRAALPDLLSAVRCAGAHELVERPALADGEFEIVRCEVEPPAAAAGAEAEEQAQRSGAAPAAPPAFRLTWWRASSGRASRRRPA